MRLNDLYDYPNPSTPPPLRLVTIDPPMYSFSAHSQAQYSSLTRRWLSLSMKLPRFRVLFFRWKRLNRPPDRLFFRVEGPRLDLRLGAAPPRQKRIVERSRQAVAAHMKPKLYLPRSAERPADRKLWRPRTNAALCVGEGFG